MPYLPIPLVSHCEKGGRYYLDTDPGPGTTYKGHFYTGPFEITGPGRWDVKAFAVTARLWLLPGVTSAILGDAGAAKAALDEVRPAGLCVRIETYETAQIRAAAGEA